MLVSGAAVSTVQACVAGVWSVFLAASTARTWKVWAPSTSPLWLLGEAQAANAAVSSLHSKVAPASLAEKVNVAAVWLVGSAGAGGAIVVSGGVVSGGGLGPRTVSTNCGRLVAASFELKSTPLEESAGRPKEYVPSPV